ncbi:MAG: DUF397 domain-containing protein [Pseudonocardiales bacterium]|nr:DUF397 domain-containing protein [Pseudonocardiales bacterium]MBV9032318.1 DUF397 domain-containing protein [Pseudonocardiales bacterium]MBV9140541.1 DUF397 domain-containing protein [Pseudonocardiales bacterium]
MHRPTWRKSSYSSDQGGACLEVCELDSGHRAVRDGKDPGGAVLRFTAAEWSAFTTGICTGQFD